MQSVTIMVTLFRLSVSCKLTIRVIPNAPRSQVVGWLGEALKVKIHAPAREGRANDELCAFLAQTLGLHRRAVTVTIGEKSRQKTVLIENLDLDQVHARLEQILHPD